MQHNSQIFLNDYELPCPGTPPPRNLRPNSPTELVPPRKQPSSTRSKSFQDRPERPPREPTEPSRDYEVVGGYLQMPSPHNSRASVNGQRSNSCVEAIPYIGSDRDRDRSKTPERSEKRNRTPDRPQHKNSGKTPENQRRDRAKTPEKRDRAKTPEKRDRAKTPDRGRRSKSRTPDRLRHRSPDNYSERNNRADRRARSPPQFPAAMVTMPTSSISTVPYPPLPDRIPGSTRQEEFPAAERVQVAELPLPAKVQVVDHPLSDQVDLSAGERRETEPFVVGRSDTIKRADQEPESSDSRYRDEMRKAEEAEKYQNSSSSSGKRRSRQQDSSQDNRYRVGGSSRHGDVRMRAYSDSDAENYQEAGLNGHNFRHPLNFRHRDTDRNGGQIPPLVYTSENTDRFYRIPYRIPYNNRPLDSYDDSDYDNLPGRPTSKSNRTNGALLMPSRGARGRGECLQEFNTRDPTRYPDLEYRPYPARFAPPEPPCPYYSETTENEYLTPAEQAAANKGSRHRRSHSDTSSSRTIMSPWSKDNRILTPKYPLLSTRDQTLTSQDRTLENASQRLSKVKCPVSSNNGNHGNNNMWHDPLLGVDKKHIALVGEVESQQSKGDSKAESFAEFTTEVSMNYLRFIWNSPELIRKLLWAVLFLGFFVYSFQCCLKSFNTYFSMPTSTKYNMYFEPNKLLRFPSITICNMNPHNTAYLDKEENNPMKAYLLSESRVPWDTSNLTPDVSETDYRNFNVKKYYRQAGQKLNDFISEVVFFEEEIETSDAFREQFTTHGMCWTFNADGSRQVNRTGMDFGLSFKLNINQSSYPNFVTTAGVKVMFHNYYEPALIDEYGLALTPGTENFISLSYERVRNLKQPYGDCRDDAMPLYRNYSISGCERQCFTEIMIKECNCSSYYLKAMPGGKDVECNLYQEKNCVKELIRRYHAGEFINSSECRCPDPCVSESYLATLSTAEYPAKNHGEALQRYNEANRGPNDVVQDVTFYRENLMKVHIYFEILSIKEVEKVGSYKWSNLMGDVGGQLGLFLGANIVTIFDSYKRRRGDIKLKPTTKQNSSFNPASIPNDREQDISPLITSLS
ncbi:hypothetical protein ACHWQZ_G016058 [Mnemiopsis leidyi]